MSAIVSRETRSGDPDGLALQAGSGETESGPGETASGPGETADSAAQGAPGLPPAPNKRPVSRETRPSAPARLALLPIRAYRRFLSPALGARCRYYPTCSTYAEQSIRELGALRGMTLAIWRVLRCNPLSNGGLDPVSNRRFFRSTPSAQAHVHASGGCE